MRSTVPVLTPHPIPDCAGIVLRYTLVKLDPCRNANDVSVLQRLLVLVSAEYRCDLAMQRVQASEYELMPIALFK
jgi:hypothetical protein